jgi:hypothetical protein
MAWSFMLWTSINGHDLVNNTAIRSLLPIGVIVGFALMLLGAAIGVVVFLFNRPRFLVPPPLRSDHGLLSELATNRDARAP